MNFQIGLNNLAPVSKPADPAAPPADPSVSSAAVPAVATAKNQIDVLVAGARNGTATAFMTAGGVTATGFVNGSGILAAGAFAAMTGNVAAAGIVASAFALNYVTKIVSKPLAAIGATIGGERVKDVFNRLWP